MGVYRRWGKRALDLALAVPAGVLSLPVAAGLAAVSLVALGENPFFRQRRIGRGGRPFTLIKLKTLRTRRDASGALLPDVERLTGWGGWLRRSSLDELPQLWLVLVGEMSVVGPRPLLPEYESHYSERQRLRHAVKPGLTGLAQISGRNALDWPTQLELDAQYAERVSLRLDLWIVWHTPGVWLRGLLWGRGIAADAQATRKRFDLEP